MTTLTKSKFLAGLQCHKLQWTRVNQPELFPESTPRGSHKLNVGIMVGELAKELFPGGVDMPTDDFKDNIDLTQDALSKNVPIYEAGILAGDLYSRLDVLNPNEDGSFDIIEVKSGTSVKDQNIHDVAFQKYCCKEAGIEIASCHLCFLNNKYIRQGDIDVKNLFTVQNITAEVDDAIKGIPDKITQQIKNINLKSRPEVTIGPHCDNPYSCDLKGECWAFLPENSVFTLYYDSKKGWELFESGVYGLKDIPEEYNLSDKQRIQKETLKSDKVHIEPENINAFLETLEYPLYYLDFETFAPAIPKYDNSWSYLKIPFQYSLHIQQEDGSLEHESFLFEGSEDPRPSFLASLEEALNSRGSIVVYHQSFEKGVLKELAEFSPDYKEWVEGLTPRFRDLLNVFRGFHYYNPSQRGSASLKKVLPALTDRSYDEMEIPGGNEASFAWENMIFGEVREEEVKKTKKDLLDYCELDTYAEVLMIEKLRELI